MSKKILIVDDDREYASVLSKYLLTNGFHTSILFNGNDVCDVLSHTDYDCIILDIYLGDCVSFNLCKEIRLRSQAPIIFISNYSSEKERIQSFLSGGVDYLAKPFPLEELKLRLIRRLNFIESDNSDFVIDEEAFILRVNNQVVDLTSTEFEILLFLYHNENKVFSQMEIYSQVWNQQGLDSTHTVQVHVSSLRKKLDEYSGSHHYIQTVWGRGYKFINKEEK